MLQKRYCRNISYLARMFLQHKTLQADVEIFYFYVLYAKQPDNTYHLIGYFSKEKLLATQQGQVPINNILSCILTMPCYQSKGYGSILIDMAYLLASRDNLIGSPEKPLSDLGYMAFHKYWKYRISEYLTEHESNQISLADIVQHTNFTAMDIQSTMRMEKMLIPRNTGDFVCYVPREKMEEFFASVVKMEKRHAIRIQEKYLHYYPCVYVQREAKPELDQIVVKVQKL